MSKELDQKLLTVLMELCGNEYNRPTEFDSKTLQNKTQENNLEISHSLNNLQRKGLIRIIVGLPGEPNKVELLKQA
ncbi:MAG TPA: hypothetical protein VIM29_09100 [Bacillota bacterium]